jgi:hypothetical protein
MNNTAFQSITFSIHIVEQFATFYNHLHVWFVTLSDWLFIETNVIVYAVHVPIGQPYLKDCGEAYMTGTIGFSNSPLVVLTSPAPHMYNKK